MNDIKFRCEDKYMDLIELISKVNGLDLQNKNTISEIVNSINISGDNFNEWVENVFSEKVNDFDMNKLPYLIDELYKSNEVSKFLLCCMLLEATCDKLGFVTNLENYPIVVEKFKTLLNTLVTVYEHVDNGIANCMSLIIINNDPEFKHFDNELKNRLVVATRRKLKAILNYLKTQDVDDAVFDDLEVIVDMACYLKDSEINKLIEEIDNFGSNSNADLFIIKYKIINNLNVSTDKIEKIVNGNNGSLVILYQIMEELNVQDKYLKEVSQEKIAMSEMIRWLCYPTELASIPDKIELLGEFTFNNTKCFAFKFSKEDFRIKGDLLGVAGGYPMDKISATSSGYTFSQFEAVTNNWEAQARNLVNFIAEHWKRQIDNNK